MTGEVALVLGRAPGPSSVLHEVRALLAAAGVRTRVVLDDEEVLEGTADLHVLKDLGPEALHRLAALGVPCCNAPAAAAVSLDKARVVEVLQAAGVPVPATTTASSWQQVRTAAATGPVVVKPLLGTQGDGVLLLDGPAPVEPVAPGPWLLQERVHGDGLDRKLYVVGRDVDGVVRTWPAPRDRSGRPFVPDALLREVALACADALGLELCGVDVLLTPEGPVVVDVNAFPGYKGVPAAASRIAGHLLARLARTEVTACA